MARGIFYQLQAVQGEDLEVSIDIERDGSLVPIVASDFVGQVADGDTDPEFQFFQNDTDPFKVDIQLGADYTALIAPGNYGYEVKYTDPNTSKIKTVLYGSIEIKETRIGG